MTCEQGKGVILHCSALAAIKYTSSIFWDLKCLSDNSDYRPPPFNKLAGIHQPGLTLGGNRGVDFELQKMYQFLHCGFHST